MGVNNMTVFSGSVSLLLRLFPLHVKQNTSNATVQERVELAKCLSPSNITLTADI